MLPRISSITMTSFVPSSRLELGGSGGEQTGHHGGGKLKMKKKSALNSLGELNQKKEQNWAIWNACNVMVY
jgi:hypothetical protein